VRQKQALAIMMSGANVFLTGAPGAGKTYVLNQYIKRAERAGKVVAVTASTGIAATHLNGTTIHSWSGLGIRDYLTSDDRRWLADNERLIKRYNSTNVLVIDEVSMLHGKRLDMINEAAKILRDNEAPFGGLQIIMVGDLFQLPPISRGGEAIDFMHSSAAWRELKPEICYVTEQHRQAGHDGLLALLEAMRRGEVDEVHEATISDRLGREPDKHTIVTRLYSHNVDVEAINQRYLDALDHDSICYTMQPKGRKSKVEVLVKSVLAPESLELKIGAEVMFVANNFAEGYVNGSRGKVIDFKKDLPVVRLMNGRIITVEPHTWSISEDGKVRAEVAQIPLRLAWAITIHKSQGMSLDAAEVDLSRAFTPSMGYVALSRVRSLDGLYIKGINRMAMMMHPDIYSFDVLLRQASAELAAITEDFDDEAYAATAEPTETTIDTALFEKLKHWRYERATLENIPSFMIAHNASLSAVASVKPKTPQQLLMVPGFGSKKVEQYGPDIVAIVLAN
jgi:ATP-dependent DNA helicase PIF1